MVVRRRRRLLAQLGALADGDKQGHGIHLAVAGRPEHTLAEVRSLAPLLAFVHARAPEQAGTPRLPSLLHAGARAIPGLICGGPIGGGPRRQVGHRRPRDLGGGPSNAPNRASEAWSGLEQRAGGHPASSGAADTRAGEGSPGGGPSTVMETTSSPRRRRRPSVRRSSRSPVVLEDLEGGRRRNSSQSEKEKEQGHGGGQHGPFATAFIAFSQF
uniref:Uncharacterized protein n=1 Tax=Setaria italica TaxID=4555 RepID=K3ZJU4_SETIT